LERWLLFGGLFLDNMFATSTAEALIAVQGVYLFAIGMGITSGGIFGLAILLLRHRKAKAYDLYSDQ